MLSLVLWRPKSVFDTTFNKFVAYVTNGDYCHAECVFTFTKQQWKDKLLAFDKNYGLISTRAKSLWARIASISEDNDDSDLLSLCFYTIWGSRLSVRLLTQFDDYVFNRLPDNENTTSLNLSFNHDEMRHALAFCVQELDKGYDSYKAIFYFLPEAFIRRPISPALPTKYFCSEFLVYMLKQVGYLKHVIPEKVTPNHLPGLYKTLENEIKFKHQYD